MRKRYEFIVKAEKAGIILGGKLGVISEMDLSELKILAKDIAAEQFNNNEECYENDIVFTADDVEIISLNVEIDLESLFIDAVNKKNAEAFANAINEIRNNQ